MTRLVEDGLSVEQLADGIHRLPETVQALVRRLPEGLFLHVAGTNYKIGTAVRGCEMCEEALRMMREFAEEGPAA